MMRTLYINFVYATQLESGLHQQDLYQSNSQKVVRLNLISSVPFRLSRQKYEQVDGVHIR
jgi:hypothetical protein